MTGASEAKTWASSAHRCAICALVLSVLAFGAVGAAVAIGAWIGADLVPQLAASGKAQADLKLSEAHLQMQMSQMSQSDKGLGERLQTLEQALAALQSQSSKHAAPTGDSERKGKRRGSGKDDGEAAAAKAKSKAAAEDAPTAKAQGDGKEEGGDDSDDSDDEKPSKGKHKGKKRGKRRGKGR